MCRRHVAEDGAANDDTALLGDNNTEVSIRLSQWLGQKGLHAVQLEHRIRIGKSGMQQTRQLSQSPVVGIVDPPYGDATLIHLCLDGHRPGDNGVHQVAKLVPGGFG